ncbi:Asp-tRNA(Asn)/Glu-tRNA(Gln) amidotransferase GatCAB subunit C [Candidatus Falkowbacteria bacterium CG10_big_fil_rev_8_21_14_0_10_44_15]|uniref:Aspartyl/glutamyl-tRNA(Asn/Gln) amidotransferase subunit C n=1 Tax=Candidatus Falkowbacteria bacterium CG10_big_fil_rev_8_21_14_0_10_44_15 TaxID=1974569 RepID=A0A2H0V0W5_9BACT|nr:MAG: Asp-tRNA(Asn)/Glu-tRNA(Gln) amidotransferase GatCAB subunit C [Candidatus Falkowbacteria bacterium CG10_big_fil_rev_8_21_14_0_10_44_15]
MKLSKQEIQHIADLARLELTDEELEKYGSQLSDVLNYIDQLKEVDTSNIEPTAQVTGMENIMRADEAENWPLDETEAALGQAPEREGKYVKVRRVLNS